MNKLKPKIYFIILFSLFCFLSNYTQITSEDKNYAEDIKTGFETKLLTPHNPIMINGDADFDTQANGNWDNGGTLDGLTAASAYEIKDYLIDSATPAINIIGTTRYFKIDTCTIKNSIDGIVLNNVQNSLITNCTLISNSIGITINNTSTNNKVEASTIYDSANGIFMFHCDVNTIVGCDIYNTSDSDIFVGEGIYNFFEENILKYSKRAIEFHDSINNTVYLNTIDLIAEDGLYLDNTETTTIRGNQIQNCDLFGVNIVSGTGNSIRGNNFIDNNPTANSQAQDNGVDNTFQCNHWNTWTSPNTDGDKFVDTPYSIMGSASNTDTKPLVNPITDLAGFKCPFSIAIVIPSLFFVTLSALIYKKRFKK
ncbi:MAG: hypothetical protein FK733_01080 [Asgard group archaeon]|nr:hypothetical protein [Asgard group archaeon]